MTNSPGSQFFKKNTRFDPSWNEKKKEKYWGKKWEEKGKKKEKKRKKSGCELKMDFIFLKRYKKRKQRICNRDWPHVACKV